MLVNRNKSWFWLILKFRSPSGHITFDPPHWKVIFKSVHHPLGLELVQRSWWHLLKTVEKNQLNRLGEKSVLCVHGKGENAKMWNPSTAKQGKWFCILCNCLHSHISAHKQKYVFDNIDQMIFYKNAGFFLGYWCFTFSDITMIFKHVFTLSMRKINLSQRLWHLNKIDKSKVKQGHLWCISSL